MNKTQFNELLAYLRNRPSEREKLRMVLMGESELQADPQQQNLREADQWLTARKVGEQIGMSAKWVKERLQALPPGTYERRGNRGTWWINATVNINQLTQMRA